MLRSSKISPLRLSLGLLGYLALLACSGLSAWAAPALPTDWLHTNLQAVRINNPNRFSFAVFADSRDDQGRFDLLVDNVNHDPAIAFSLHLGDLVNHPDESLYQAFFSQVSRLAKPLLTAIGNHEVEPNQAYGRSLYAAIFGPAVGPFYYSFQIGQAYFIVLDDANSLVLDPTQQTWLVNELQQAQSYRFRFVFLHVPLFDPRGENHSLPLLTAFQLQNLFQTHQVSQIFAAHIHGYFHGTWGGVPFVITGGAGAPLDNSDPAHYFFHHLRVDVNDNDFTVTVRKTAPIKPDNPAAILLLLSD